MFYGRLKFSGKSSTSPRIGRHAPDEAHDERFAHRLRKQRRDEKYQLKHTTRSEQAERPELDYAKDALSI